MIRLLAAVALMNATVYTGDGPPLENATVLIDDNRVTAVGANVEIPEFATRLQLKGAVITPGFIDAASRIGVVEVRSVPSTIEATLESDDPVRASLRVADTFNPDSLVIPYVRQSGLTSAVVIPRGGLIAGQSIWADLTPQDPMRKRALALHIGLGKTGKQGGRAAQFLRLREVLDDARLFHSNRGPYISRRLRDLSVSASDLAVMHKVIEREMPVVIQVDRASDIRTALELIRTYKLRGILLGVAEGWVVADEIARAKVPVLVDPTENLPTNFDTLQSRIDNAHLMHQAGVRVAFTSGGGAHFASRLRYNAGVAVANGFKYDDALAAITRVPAEIFGMVDAGQIKPGALANIVVWNGDPFEPLSWPTAVYIRGIAMDLQTRQDLLTERYLKRGILRPEETPR